jgi:predicted DNA-binding transcriptional regulator YafY
MSQTLLRQWIMLKYIPRSPNKIDAASIKVHLDQKGYDISKRSIERDLKALSEEGVFPIEKDDRDRPYGWYWPRNIKPLDIPGMDSLMALSYVLIEQHIRDILPSSVTASLKPYFSQARAVLKEGSAKNKLSYLPEKIRLLDRGPMQKSPKVPAVITDAIHQALLQNKKLSATYLPRDKERHDSYEINPLALIFKGGVAYLICTLWEYSDIKQLALHRFSQASLLSEEAKVPEGFGIDDYISTGKLSYLRSDKPIKFSATISDFMALHLTEQPLADNQKIVRVEGGRHKLSASIADSDELLWWILSFGTNIEVLKPVFLRKEIKVRVNEIYKLYKD